MIDLNIPPSPQRDVPAAMQSELKTGVPCAKTLSECLGASLNGDIPSIM